MIENKKEPLKIIVSGYDVRVTEAATVSIAEKLTQLRLTFSGPIFFPSHRIVVAVPSSPHKHKDAQEKYQQITHQRKFFVLIPSPASPATLNSLLKLEVPKGVDLRFVNLPQSFS